MTAPFKPIRLTRGQQILIAKTVKVTPAREAKKRTIQTSQMRDRRRGYGRLR